MSSDEIRRPDPVYVLRQVSSDEVTSATFLTVAGTELLFAGSSDGRIYSWELNTFKLVDSLSGHAPKSIVHLMTWRQSQLVSQGADGRIKLWWRDGEPSQLTPFREWPCSSMLGIRACLLGDLLAVPCQDGTAADIVNLESSQVQYSLPPAPKDRGMLLAIRLLSSQLFLVSYEDGTLDLVHLPTKQVVASLPVAKPDNPIFSLDTLHPDLESSDIAAVGLGGFLYHLEVKGQELSVKDSKNFKADVSSALILPKQSEDGHLVIGMARGSIKVVCLSKFRTVAHLNFHTRSVTSFVVSPSGKLLAACSKDSKVTLWSLGGLCSCSQDQR